MPPLDLDCDLKKPKNTLDEFYCIAVRAKEYMRSSISHSVDKNDYTIFVSESSKIKYVRPINRVLYIAEPKDFESAYRQFSKTLAKIKTGNLSFTDAEKNNVDSFLYTVQQSIGAGLDLLVPANTARKHTGNRFEELIKVVFNEIGVANKKIVLRIPYPTDQGEKIYNCENDLILSPAEKVISTSEHLDESEIVVSIKNTSKDRMGKIFIDKILLERFVQHPLKVIGIFNNDVQRKENHNISFTLVSGLFMVYRQFLTPIEGVYYLDPPPNAFKEPCNRHIKRFSELITNDIFGLLKS